MFICILYQLNPFANIGHIKEYEVDEFIPHCTYKHGFPLDATTPSEPSMRIHGGVMITLLNVDISLLT